MGKTSFKQNLLIFYDVIKSNIRPFLWSLIIPGAGLFLFEKYFRACFYVFLWSWSLIGILCGKFILDETYGNMFVYTSSAIFSLIYFASFIEVYIRVKIKKITHKGLKKEILFREALEELFKGNFKKSTEMFYNFIEDDPDDIESRVYLTESYYRTNKYTEAIYQCEECLDRDADKKWNFELNNLLNKLRKKI